MPNTPLPYNVYQGALGNPAGTPGSIYDYLKDWAAKGEGRGVIGAEGVPVDYETVLQDMSQRLGMDISGLPQHVHDPALGVSYAGTDVANPYANIYKQYQDLAQGVVGQQKGQYEQLQQQLAGNAAQYNTSAAGNRAGIVSDYDKARADVTGVGGGIQQKLMQEANAMGLQQALGGNATQQLSGNLSRIQAMMDASRGQSLGNFDTLNNVYQGLLANRQGQANMMQTSAANSALEAGRNRYGLADPGELYAELLQQTNQAQLAGKQGDIDLANLQLQLQQAQQAAAGGGGGGGGGGRRSSGGGSSSAMSTGWPPTYEEALAAAGGDTNAADTIIRLVTPNEGLQARLDTYNPPIPKAYKGTPTGGGRKAV